jgi:hypothetical protein
MRWLPFLLALSCSGHSEHTTTGAGDAGTETPECGTTELQLIAAPEPGQCLRAESVDGVARFRPENSCEPRACLKLEGEAVVVIGTGDAPGGWSTRRGPCEELEDCE